MEKLFKLASIYAAFAQNMLAPGESTMSSQDVKLNLEKLKKTIDYLTSVPNSSLTIMFKDEAQIARDFVEDALSNRSNAISNKEKAKQAVSAMRTVLAGQMNVDDALKAISYYGSQI